jgi:hypothetical protein
MRNKEKLGKKALPGPIWPIRKVYAGEQWDDRGLLSNAFSIGEPLDVLTEC